VHRHGPDRRYRVSRRIGSRGGYACYSGLDYTERRGAVRR